MTLQDLVKRNNLYTLICLAVLVICRIPVFSGESAGNYMVSMPGTSPPDSLYRGDTTLRYPFVDETVMPGSGSENPIYLKNPSNIKTNVEYDPVTRQYYYNYKIGETVYRIPTTLSFDEFQNQDMQSMINQYWKERSEAATMDNATGIIPKIRIPGKVFETIFGNNTVDIRPQGSAEIDFGIVSNRRDDPMLSTRQRRQTNFDFNEKIQMNVVAKIGDKIEFKINYNTEATFDFENKLKLRYEGKEDDIIQLIEAGDVNLPLSTNLIRGTESLFGVKTKLRFGRVTVTALYSQQKSETKNIVVQGNAQTQRFRIRADEYEENKHFFIGQNFRDTYRDGLKKLPVITSNVNILKIEVWATNIGAAVTENRNIVAFMDLGEYNPYNTRLFTGNPARRFPSNNSNDLFQVLMPNAYDSGQVRSINTVSGYLKGAPFYMIAGEDFEKVESARKLLPSEYSFNPKLGFISLNTALNSDQILAVAYQYQVVGDTTVHQVGEFSDQGIASPKSLVVKLLKSTSLNTRVPTWKLMMKNVYALGAYQLQGNDFTMNILYSGNANGVPTAYITEGRIKGVPLLRVLNLDNVNQQFNPPGDGMFDFIDNAVTQGGTIQASNGRIFFTVLEPFGKDLRDSIYDPADPKGSLELANKYCFDSLYTMTKSNARQYPDKNKFVLDGFYKSAAGAEISLNALNVPAGSVRVTAGGIQLMENQDYTVDYTLGRVRIINEGILNSGTAINISLESNEMFNVQTKRLMGAHIDYKINKDFVIGATILNLNERPLTQKVNYGDEPMSNTMWGMNLTYRTQSRLITRFVDALPLITTKAPSSIAVDVEFAQFIPGHSKAIGRSGTTYIDDFEGAQSTIDMKSMSNWYLASTPQGQTTPNMFPEAAPGPPTLSYGFNRSKLGWYIIDPLFYDKNTNLLPPNVSNQELANHYVRQVWETEIFPNKQPLNGVPVNLSVLNLAYYPSERGSYNFDVSPTSVSKGLNADGTLANPETRWGGVMRKIESTDFDATNIQYIEFWMMDPFIYDTLNSGQLYFNLGDISEDILRDGRKSFENGLPTTALVTEVDTTIWGRVPQLQALVDAFDNTPATRPFQDVGYDGLTDVDEISFFDTSYVAKVRNTFGANSQAYINASSDPSSDDFHYFRGTDYDENPNFSSVLNRYKKYNGPEGNSPTTEQSVETYPTIATTLPNMEDINKDNTLSEAERYYQYVVQLRRDQMKTGSNYITNIYHATDIPLADGTRGNVNWYQFKIPIRTPDQIIGTINDFTSIRFMRVFFKNFQRPVVCRFATLELSRGEWRKYNYSLLSPGEYIPNAEQNQTQFDIAAVSLEENGSKQPIPYVMPPGIERETNWGSTNMQKLNEQSMSFKVCNLVDGDARAAYKNAEFDFRQFKRLQMYVHAEQSVRNQNLKPGDLTIIMRIGSDFTENYYEYEIPLNFTAWGTQANNPDAIWPESNAFDIDLERLVRVKYNRLVAMRDKGIELTSSTPYSEFDGKNKITVVGSPTISDVRAIMVGVRNPKKSTQTSDDDGQSKCAEIWVDELRLSEFNKNGGFAATARVAVELADLGRIQLTGTYSSSGFGTLEQKQTQRPMEAVTTFGFDTDLELGKFFPAKTGIRIPMHFDYAMMLTSPKYDPLNPDLYLSDVIDAFDSKQQKDSIKQITQGYTQTKNFNLMNVRKDRTGTKKPKIYDIENFNASYAYSEIFHRDVDVAYDLKKKYTGGFGYNYSTQPKNVVPFQRVKALNKSKAFALIKDFNFYYLPKAFSFRTDMNREFNQRQFRNKSRAIVPMETFYIKRWDWSRTFDLKYDFAKSLRLTLVANTQAFVNEPPGQIDRSNRDQIWSEILSFGTKNNYNQALNVSWDVPIGKIPMLDFITLQAGYLTTYRWMGAPISIQEQYGNTIENANVQTLNGGFNLVTLYNKIPYLKRINQASTNQRGNKPEPPKNKNLDKQDSLKLLPNRPKIGKILLEGTVRFLMAVRTAKFTYTQGNGTLLPGFKPEPVALGNNWNLNAPGLGFVFGSQNDIRYKAADNGWITNDTMLNTQMFTKFTENLSLAVSIEPLKDLRIEVVGSRQYSKSHSEYFKANSAGDFAPYSPYNQGSFTTSYIIIATSFAQDDGAGKSPTFETMKQYRLQIAQRYAAMNPNSRSINDSTGFPNGYGPTDQEVLTSAFLAAYAGKDPAKIKLTAFPTIPLPNWRLTYDGLAKLKIFKTWLRTFTITHAYLSTYSVGSFNSNIYFKEVDGMPSVVDDAGNFIPEAQTTIVSITEQFNPLIKFDLGFINSLLPSAEMRRSRNISLSFVNNQLTEITSNEFIVGLGYRLKGIRFNLSGMLGGGKKTKTNSDLNLKLDFSIRKNKTVLRRVDQDINQISVGQQVMTLNFSADYNLSARFNVRFYFDKVINTPYVSNQYRTSNTKGGIALRFTLGN